MGDIAQRGNRLTKKVPNELRATLGGLRPRKRTFKTHGRDVPTMAAKGGRIGFRHGKGPHGFGPKPYLHKPGVGPHGQPGGRVGKVVGGAIKIGKILGKKGVDYIWKNRKAIRKEVYSPEGTKKAQDMIDKLKRKYPDSQMFGPAKKAEGGRIGFKKGTDKRWMQKVSASIKRRGTKGKCTPITKPGCTGRAKALAKTFKKIAAKRKAA